MIDVKKLITGFLVLAVAGVCSGIILSWTGSLPSAPQAQSGTAGPSIADSNTAPITTGFTDTGSLQGNAAEMLAATVATTTVAASADSNNLTNIFADSILNGLVQANPGGVSTDAAGNLNFNAPDAQSMATEIASSSVLSGFTAPNWDAEAQSQVINIEKNLPSDAVQQYQSAVTAAFNQYFVTSGVQSEVSGQSSGDPTQAASIASQSASALAAILAIPTPPSMVTFQRSMVRALIYEKNTADAVANSGNDPVKTALIIQSEDAKSTAAINNLKSAEQAASSVGLSFTNSTAQTQVPFLAELFGVQAAHAQWEVFDPANLFQLVKQYLEDIALQILKNTLVSLIQQKVLTWIQGSGAPRFVQSFATQMVSSYEGAALNQLSSYMKCVPTYQYQTFANLLTTPAVANPGNNASPGQVNTFCSQEFNSQITTHGFNQFLYGFTNFNDYLQLFQPGGNIWSASLQASDAANAAGTNSQQANQNKNTAQQGWSGSEVCDDGSNPGGQRIVCVDGSTGYTYASDGGKCDPGSVAQYVPNNGLCSDGTTPTITSPGQVTGQGFFTGLKSGVENITSASNIAGILYALLNSLLNQLAQNAINYAQQTVVNGLNGTGGGGTAPSDSGVLGVTPTTVGTTNASTSAATPSSPTACFPNTQTLTISTTTGTAVATLNGSGGAINTTCAVAGNCPAGTQSDGSPTYTWSAPGSSSGGALNGSSISITYTTPGTYNVSVNASTDNTAATCQVIVQ